MLCQKCGKNNATSHIHTVVNGVVNDSYLCSDCAAELQAAGFGENSFYKMLSSFFEDGVQKNVNTKRCECCGAAIEEISKTGKVGCGNCYKVFGEELKPALIRIHGRTSHIGKKPGEMQPLAPNEAPIAENDKEAEIKTLRAELKKAIENEEYERAAEIRDKIRETEGKE